MKSLDFAMPYSARDTGGDGAARHPYHVFLLKLLPFYVFNFKIGAVRMKTICGAITGLLIFTVHLSIALGQGATAFTYQGNLQNNGTNVTGATGMIFALYDFGLGGTPITPAITNDVAVSNGLFTVTLDFGAGAFNGQACWLDIAISNGVRNVELSPRTQVLPTPYATFANTASNIAAGAVSTGTFIGDGSGLLNVGANLQMQVFPNYGTYTFNVPTNVSSVIVEAWGGGGGGGGGYALYDRGGGGGGAGGYAKGVVTVTPGASYTVVVGQGGLADSEEAETGGSSSFGSAITAGGGTPGQFGSGTSTLTTGGAGGQGSGQGGSGTILAITGGIGQFGVYDVGGGNGGNAPDGGAGGLGNLGAGGTAGTVPGGGGGGGGYSSSSSDAGYDGGSGEVVVYY